MGELIGTVTHFFPKISVCVIKLTQPLKKGEKIKFKHGEEEFEQEVSSMQVEHKELEEAKAGMEVGMKTDKPVKEGFEVYRASGGCSCC
ncbi:MAG: hypothetical protein PHO02_07150 [Candidatus Nanoarchaeia archaeon]|nr:hypothetical protein [Candidatus Nanoarchaeia archaeon]